MRLEPYRLHAADLAALSRTQSIVDVTQIDDDDDVARR
jgi:hypothetical protein